MQWEALLSHAISYGIVSDGIALLIDEGADVNLADEQGYTPLMKTDYWPTIDVLVQ